MGEASFQKIPEENTPLKKHAILELLYLMDLKSLQILELVNQASFNVEEIARLVMKRVEELKKIYSENVAATQMPVADKKFFLWVSPDNILVASFVNPSSADKFEAVARRFVEQPFYDMVVKVDQVKTALKFLEKANFAPKDVTTFFRLVTDDRLFTQILVKYPENIPRILKRLNEEFKFQSEVLEPFLYGEVTMNDLLGPNLIARASELFDLVDFINRRNLLL